MSTLLKASPRENMVKSQILTGHVLSEPAVAAFLEVAREEFVPAKYQKSAYLDEEIPLGNGRFLMEPLAFARMVENAGITRQENVLLVGCGTGYSAAILSRIARCVVAVEEDKNLLATAQPRLSPLANVALIEAPLLAGENSRAPYDVILIEGAAEFIPQALADQLREGGRLLTFEYQGEARPGTLGLAVLVEYKKIRGLLYRTAMCNASVAPLAAFKMPPAFTF